MVEIREESSEPFHPSTSSGAGTSRAPPAGAPQGTMTLSQYVSANMMDCCLLVTRLMTLFFTLCYLLPFLSPVAPDSAYYKAFAAAAATNALRMQQRVGTVSFTREFLARLLLEDSCHYLFYAILFLTSAPVTMALLSISLFAALHAAAQMYPLTESVSELGCIIFLAITLTESALYRHQPDAVPVLARRPTLPGFEALFYL
ncbi:hypothetical protein ANCCEY_07462 [Ancylostoma ceylanicum]|uniref:Uncharacterized protein n=1 Tax=Ancylostoma ceylanicum TaxID=53326 RepID=A0A0D6LMY8_9BILA|nr:hypothetical protein ANCCEY_07462 [Ancylostoma ceylanicum]